MRGPDREFQGYFRPGGAIGTRDFPQVDGVIAFTHSGGCAMAPGPPLDGQRIFAKILSVAAGERTKSEIAGLGDEGFAPWMPGPVS